LLNYLSSTGHGLQSGSTEFIDLRQLEILESSNGEVELDPVWRVVEDVGLFTFLDARGRQIRVTDPTQVRIVGLLAKRRIAPSELLGCLAKETGQSQIVISGFLRALLAQGLLRAVLKDSGRKALGNPLDVERFQHQLAFFRSCERVGSSAIDMQNRLFESKVTVVGIGGLGASVAQILLASGVRQLRLVDGDTVERSNLPRQFLFSEQDIGVPKVDALAKRLLAFDGRARIEPVREFLSSQEQAFELLKDSDFVLMCADAPAIRLHAWVGEACLRQRVPYLAMAGPWIGPLFVPSYSPCYMCQSRFNARVLPDVELHLKTFLDAPHEPVRPAFGPGPNLTACFMASATIEYITGIDRLGLAQKRFFVDVHARHAEAE
jgi:hypothetical protein